MARRKSEEKTTRANNGANLGFEQQLWQMADKLRGHMDAAEYKHVVLGLIFLKYISDAFQERYEALKKEPHADPEDRDEYTAENVFWVPKVARWPRLQDNAKQPTIGKLIDDAMVAIEKENPSLKGVLSKDYARPSLDKHRLGELIDLIGNIGLGDKESRSKDILTCRSSFPLSSITLSVRTSPPAASVNVRTKEPVQSEFTEYVPTNVLRTAMPWRTVVCAPSKLPLPLNVIL